MGLPDDTTVSWSPRWCVCALLALGVSCSRSSTDFCSASAPACPDGYTCVEDRCQYGSDAGTDGGVTAIDRAARPFIREVVSAPHGSRRSTGMGLLEFQPKCASSG